MDENWMWLCRCQRVSRHLLSEILGSVRFREAHYFEAGAIAGEQLAALKGAIARETLERWWQWQNDQGIQFTTYFDASYPAPLRQLRHPPLILWYLGEPVWHTQSAIGIVGSRNLTPQADSWMHHHLPQFFRRNNLATVSGGARGVDQLAHWLTLTESRPTMVHLPVGLMSRYPRELKSYESAILKSRGCLLSGFLPDVTLQKSNFQIRNWWIAAMAEKLLIVQSKERGGTMLTANAAAEIGTPVGAVPWSALDLLGKGCLDLIYNGAQMVRDHLDLDLFWQGQTSKNSNLF